MRGDGELLAAHLAQPLGHLAKKLVAAAVPEAVVDELHVVEVQVQHRHTDAPPLGSSQRRCQQLLEQCAVGQAGQLVVVGQESDFVLEPLLTSDVPDERREQRDDVGVDDRRDAAFVALGDRRQGGASRADLLLQPQAKRQITPAPSGRRLRRRGGLPQVFS